jgi:MFS family permease
LLLGLTALTSAFGAIVAIAVLAGLLVDEWLRHRTRDPSRAGAGMLVVGALLTLGGLVVAYAQAARPPDDTGIYSRWLTKFDVGLGASSSASIWRALVPIPALKHSYWNTNILHARAAIVGVLGVLLFVALAWILRDRPGALVVWVGGAGLVVTFLYLRIGTATASRHVGHIFLCLVAAMWLAPTMTARRSTVRPGTRRHVLTVLLVAQLIAGVYAVSLDLASPFSNGLQMAQFIRAHHLEHTEIIGLPDTASSTVAGYLDRPIYYPAGARLGRYIVWDTARERLQPIAEVLQSYRPGGRHVLLLINTPVTDPSLRLRLLTHDDNGIVPDEHFWLYLGSAPA